MKNIFFIILFFLILNGVYSQSGIITPDEYTRIVGTNSLRYQNQEFTIKGAVFSTSLIGNGFTIYFYNSNNYQLISFNIPEYQNKLNSISNIEPNDIITIRGICKNENSLINCDVLNIEKRNPPFDLNRIYTYDELGELIQSRILLINNKQISVRGIIRRIGQSGNEYFINFGIGMWIDGNCFFSDYNEKEKIRNLNVGDTIILRGTFRAYTGLHNCRIISNNVQFPSNIIGTWERINLEYPHTLTFTSRTLKASNQTYNWNLSSVQGNVYKISRSIGGTEGNGTIHLRLVGERLEIIDAYDAHNASVWSGGENDWTGTWRRK